MTSLVSVIVPCFNERSTIPLLLEAICTQTYPPWDLEVIIADGMSTDGTRGWVQAYALQHTMPAVRLIDNPGRSIPSALNVAIREARGDTLVRLDAHSMPAPDYVERCVAVLGATGAANVGGVWDIRPSGANWIARSIAIAASHPLGAGDARYRTSGHAGEVDTVPFGAYRREWVERVGPFDERLLSNEDYEFNVRIRKAGGRIWFDPLIRCAYLARRDVASLARQYSRYGYWKAQMLRRHPASLRWRQALPPLFVLSGLVLAASSLVVGFARLLLGVQFAVYALILTCVGLALAVQKHDLGIVLGFPISVGTMHLAWGGSFLWGLLMPPGKQNRE